MISLIKKGSNIIGIDGAIAFTILSRIIQAGGGIITLIFIAKCLTKVEQGYYYTFGSILAIQIFLNSDFQVLLPSLLPVKMLNLFGKTEQVLRVAKSLVPDYPPYCDLQ